jgi:hypothetical protein
MNFVITSHSTEQLFAGMETDEDRPIMRNNGVSSTMKRNKGAEMAPLS